MRKATPTNKLIDMQRSRELSVSTVINKVCEWRRLNKNCYDSDFNNYGLTLHQAAEVVGLPKKSLDDYLSQLRQAREFGYNFNEYCNHKIGHMR